jgi:formamidopyrimidine-DNA glycosylase
MPELPEVELVVRELRPALEGARFVRVVLRRRRLRSLLPRNFAARLEGATVRAFVRRGKYLIAELSSGNALVMHLGMSGSFDVRTDPSAKPSKHDHVLFHLSSGKTVVFNDPRRFGSMRIHAGSTDPLRGVLGPEPLGPDFDASVLARALHGRRTTLKSALSNQRVVAGLGNIYVSEALHRARLSPLRLCTTLVAHSGAPRPELRRLVRAIRATLTDALSEPITDADRFRVYGREGDRCQRRGCRGSIRRIVQAGRSTFYCPVCQR